MTCEIAVFRPEHFEGLELKTIFNGKDEIRSRLKHLYNDPNAHLRSILVEGECVAILGLIVNWKGMAEVWSVASEAVRKAPVSYTRTVKRLLDEHTRLLGLHRVQMTVRRSYREGIHWAEVLGFRSEGVLRGFGPDKADYLMFARVS